HPAQGHIQALPRSGGTLLSTSAQGTREVNDVQSRAHDGIGEWGIGPGGHGGAERFDAVRKSRPRRRSRSRLQLQLLWRSRRARWTALPRLLWRLLRLLGWLRLLGRRMPRRMGLWLPRRRGMPWWMPRLRELWLRRLRLWQLRLRKL